MRTSKKGVSSQTKVEGTEEQSKADSQAPNDHKDWYVCETRDCWEWKKGPRSKFCKDCARKHHQDAQRLTTIKLIIKVRQ